MGLDFTELSSAMSKRDRFPMAIGVGVVMGAGPGVAGDLGDWSWPCEAIDFTMRMVLVLSSIITFLGTASPRRFALGGLFSLTGAKICRGLKKGVEMGALFSGCVAGVGEGGLGDGTSSSSGSGFSDTEATKGVFLRGMLNSLTPPIAPTFGFRESFGGVTSTGDAWVGVSGTAGFGEVCLGNEEEEEEWGEGLTMPVGLGGFSLTSGVPVLSINGVVLFTAVPRKLGSALIRGNKQ